MTREKLEPKVVVTCSWRHQLRSSSSDQGASPMVYGSRREGPHSCSGPGRKYPGGLVVAGVRGMIPNSWGAQAYLSLRLSLQVSPCRGHMSTQASSVHFLAPSPRFLAFLSLSITLTSGVTLKCWEALVALLVDDGVVALAEPPSIESRDSCTTSPGFPMRQASLTR